MYGYITTKLSFEKRRRHYNQRGAGCGSSLVCFVWTRGMQNSWPLSLVSVHRRGRDGALATFLSIVRMPSTVSYSHGGLTALFIMGEH